MPEMLKLRDKWQIPIAYSASMRIVLLLLFAAVIIELVTFLSILPTVKVLPFSLTNADTLVWGDVILGPLSFPANAIALRRYACQ